MFHCGSRLLSTVRTAALGSERVEGNLAMRKPPAASIATTSVKVPPMSTPILVKVAPVTQKVAPLCKAVATLKVSITETFGYQ